MFGQPAKNAQSAGAAIRSHVTPRMIIAMKTAALPRSLARPLKGWKLGADAVHNRLNGGVEDLDEHQEKDGADEEHRLDGG